MKRTIALLLVLAAIASLTTAIALHSCHRQAKNPLSADRIASKSATRSPANSTAAPARPAHRSYPSGWVDWTTFERRFQLTQVDAFKLRSALGHVVRDLVERRGAIAQVNRSEGDFFTVTLPALPLSDEQVDALILQVATRVVGERKAVEILSDTDGFAALAKYLSLAEMQVPQQFAFRKTAPEGHSDMWNPVGYARFEIAISTYDAGRQEMVLRSTHTGFSYTDADSIRLGWNAMAKAPSGYFRTEPILGVASKPRPMPVVMHEVGSDTYEVLNESGPGLSETVTLPRKP